MSKTQILKGILEGCVLQTISKHETYGYQLVQDLRFAGFEEVSGGTIYPILQKLEKKGIISGVAKLSPEGPKRKYFSITALGEVELNNFKIEWQEVNNSVKNVFNEGESK